MEVMCVKGHEGLLSEGNIYTVLEMTTNGNYLLAEVEVPEGFTSFAAERFAVLNPVDDWSEEIEESFWVEQPTTEYTA